MRRTKTAGLVLSVMLAICAVAASSACAEEFKFDDLGASLAGKALDTQTFRLGKATLECDVADPSGGPERFEFRELPMSIKYEDCAVLQIGEHAAITTVEYDWLLPPGVDIENSVTISVEDEGVRCVVAIPGGQSLGTNAGEVKYENHSREGRANWVDINSKLSGIAYEVVESNARTGCGQTGEKGTNGSFEGKIEVEMGGIEVEQ